jgi:hypothetical protein
MAARFPLSVQGPYDVSTTKHFRLGTRATLEDGRVFYYARHSLSTTFTRGQLLTGPAIVGNHVDRTVTATAGQFTGTIAIGATAMTAGQYEDGYFIVDTATTNPGQARKIKKNPASAGSETVTIDLYEPWEATAATSVAGSIYKNIYNDMVVHPGNAQVASVLAGVPCASVGAGNTTAQYFWVQTQGWCAVQVEGTPTVGQLLAPATAATTEAGHLKLCAGATTVDDPVVAQLMVPGTTDAHFALVDLRIRG